ncbi:MAG TPA: glutathione peroxidase [Vicinamibacterales bacterium]|nr:glutathione peroxidase [Vicinamibacterales bacterium]
MSATTGSGATRGSNAASGSKTEAGTSAATGAATTPWDFEAESITGERVPMSGWRGKVALIVNVASQCGMTPQYGGLQQLYERYRDRGFVVLGFPCNQFGAQEPGSNEEIAQFCETQYGVGFPMFSKIDVNGEQTHPLFAFLKERAPDSQGAQPIKWNFTKFLVGPDGAVLRRFAPYVPPEKVEPVIAATLRRTS